MEREDKEFVEDENLEQNAHQEERAEIEQLAREMLDRNGAEMPEELHELLERIAQGGEAAQLEEQLKAVREKRRIADRTAALVEQYLEKQGWHAVNMRGDGRSFLLGFKMENLSARLQITVEEMPACISLNITLPFICEEEYFILFSDYIMQINHKLRFGAFHVSRDAGEITFRHSYLYTEDSYRDDVMGGYIETCMFTVDQYARELSRFATGRLSDDERKTYFQSLKKMVVALSR